MEYEVLYLNENGTAKVRMTTEGRTLEQDFIYGETLEEFEANILVGYKVFESEVTANAIFSETTPDFILSLLPEPAVEPEPDPVAEPDPPNED